MPLSLPLISGTRKRDMTRIRSKPAFDFGSRCFRRTLAITAVLGPLGHLVLTVESLGIVHQRRRAGRYRGGVGRYVG